jgi:hypothetical protein
MLYELNFLERDCRLLSLITVITMLRMHSEYVRGCECHMGWSVPIGAVGHG